MLYKWEEEIQKECNALLVNGTWELVECHDCANPIGSKRVYRTKLKSNNILDKYKARDIFKRYDQVDNIDFTEILSLVVKA